MRLLPSLPITVVAADDDPVLREAFAGALEQEDDLVLVAQAVDGEQALVSAAEHLASLVVVDVRMPHGGPGLVRALRALQHRPAVVVLSGHADAATWTSMLAAGAAGYLLKGAVAHDLPSLLRRCARGEVVVTVPGAATVLSSLLARDR